MKLEKISVFIICLMVSLASCKKDDDGDIVEIVIRDRAEQQVADMDSINKYLETHYYNSSTFGVSNPDPKMSDLVITKIALGGSVPSGNTLLKNAVELKSTFFSEIDYEFYVLKLNQGGGTKSPKFSDNILVNYEGFTLDDSVFDSSINPSQFFDLLSFIPGWRKVLPDFNISESFVENNDGTVSYINSGLGVMFLPSGLGYFANATAGISSYSPLIFKFELFNSTVNDHDGDGIPSYLEDLNGDGEFLLEDDNTDGDTLPNYVDRDDDGDGVLTFNELESKTYTVNTNIGQQEPVLAIGEFEISRSKSGGTITIRTKTIKDSNGDSIPDYLDKDIKISYE